MVFLAAVFAAAAFPSTGASATARVDSGGALRYKAAPGEANQVETTETNGVVTIHDSGAVITALAGCTQVNANEVECSSVLGTLIDLGDLGDAATVLHSLVSVFGDAGGDEITGCAACVVEVSGGTGADVIVANGEEFLAGEGGNDTITGLHRDDQISGGGGDDILVGGGGRDHLVGNSGNDRLDGGRSSDSLSGDGGNDTLEGGPGGLDLLLPDQGNDTVDGGPGDNDVVLFLFQPPVVANLRAGEAAGQGQDTLVRVENIEGTFRADRLIGDKNDNRLDGWFGPDTVIGGGGDDKLLAGRFSRNNRLVGGTGNDQLVGARGDDLLRGGRGHDLIKGNRGDDRLVGGRGHDRLRGKSGDDRIRARDGTRDFVFGGPGVDQARVDPHLDIVKGIQSFF